MTCDHVSKVLKWGYNLVNGQVEEFVEVWGCTKCDIQVSEPFRNSAIQEVDHSKCGEECFGCKIQTLQINAGDAKHITAMPKKKWESELAAYRAARAEGIQPEGTSMEKINAARRASEAMGSAYDSNKGVPASKIHNKSAGSLKEAGII